MSVYGTTLFISNFYNGQDIFETITIRQFEEICKDLFIRLRTFLEKALKNANLNEKEINEIVLVGCFSRLPKIKTILKEYFHIPEKNKNIEEITRINDSINPDEIVANGPTIMAEKILTKKENNLTGFSLMDINPLSLGINVLNESADPEIKKEGDIMSALTKRGTKIPYSTIKTFQTSVDNQTTICIDIFEGEKKYVKYNHHLGKVKLFNLPKKKKGEVKIDVTFFIDVNGILIVTAIEQGSNNFIGTKIKNDDILLADKDIEKLRENNKELYFKTNSKTNRPIDFNNLKDVLKEFQDAFKQAEDEEEKYEWLCK